MASVKLDVETLDAYIFTLNMYYSVGFTDSAYLSREQTGAGKVSEELSNFKGSCNLLLDSLSKFYTDVEAFLTCIKEGTLSADEYGAKSLEAAQEKWKSGGER